MLSNDKPVNILVVVRWPVGGIRTYIRYVYNKFDTSKYHFTVIGPDIEEFHVLINDLSDIRVDSLAINNNQLSRFFFAVLKEVITGKYDIIHSHGFTSGIITSLIARVGRVQHIMTSHDVFRKQQFSGLKGVFRKIFLSFLLPKIDVIQSVSHDAEENLLETFPGLGKYKRKLLTISNGIEIERFDGTVKRDFRSELGLGERVFIIGFLGRFMSQKGFRYLVMALERLLEDVSVTTDIVVLAFGSDGFLREEQADIHNKGLTEKILFFPFEANIASILKGIDVLAIPSLWEACPLLPMEALVSGTPVIASDCIGLREVVSGTPAKIVKAGDVDSLACSIKEMINNYDKEEFLSYIPQAKKRFDVNKTSMQLKDLYSTLLQKN